MKKKDLTYTLLAVVVFSVAGYLLITQLAPKKSASVGRKVEVVDPIPSDFDGAALNIISDPQLTTDYNKSFDLKNGLGNSSPFNSL